MLALLRPAILAIALLGAHAPAAATEVMILGTYHMANPGHDLHNLKADDVLVDKRQHELADVAAGLATFRPTKVAVESSVDASGAPSKVAKYHDYLAGKLAESRNETVQVGFRLAKMAKLVDVYGIDVDGDFPFEPVQKFAAGHPPLADRLAKAGADVDRMLKELGDTLQAGTIGAGLRFLNEPRRIVDDHSFYSTLLLYGAGNEQPGAALLTAWEGRNNLICARLMQLAAADDRIVVLSGSGHAFLLRRCVQDMPGFKLVEANDYLPK